MSPPHLGVQGSRNQMWFIQGFKLLDPQDQMELGIGILLFLLGVLIICLVAFGSARLASSEGVMIISIAGIAIAAGFWLMRRTVQRVRSSKSLA